ncbi:MAG: carboxyl transferase domain-containing protein [Haliangiales bacterium]
MSPPTVLIANRGEIAIRIAQAARELGMASVCVHTPDDALCMHTRRADRSVELSGTGAAGYLDIQQIIEAAKSGGCDLLHPGYGFLSERAELAQACDEAGVTFVGPDADTLRLLGDKSRARLLAGECGVPIIEGTDGQTDLDGVRAFMAAQPADGAIVIKARAGGGGRGMRVVREASAVPDAYARCQSEARSAFGDDSLYAEALWAPARHIEVQIIGDGSGAVSHLWERECSLQRRHQKLVELAPAPGLDPDLRAKLIEAALTLTARVRYRGLCTVEFLVRGDGGFAFIEANPRLQVEHTITEEITGVDLVQAQLRIATGATLHDVGLAEPPPVHGMAMQLRVNLERVDATGTARPSAGTLTYFEPPSGHGVRVDSYAYAGYSVSPHFDSLLAKLVVRQPHGSLAALLARGRRALGDLHIGGVPTNQPFLHALLSHPDVVAGRLAIDFIDRHAADLATSETARQAEQTHSRSAPPALETGANALATAAGDLDAPTAVPEGFAGVRAELQGSVVAIEVAQDDEVQPGQTLLLMQAMKMEHAITAPVAGRVHALFVATGDVVGEGRVLLLIEDAGHSEAARATGAAIDLTKIRADLQQVIDRHAFTLDENRPDAVKRRQQTGHRTARQNLADLCDEDSFLEYGALAIAAQRKRKSLEELLTRTPADGMLSGIARVNGHLFEDERARCAVVAYDYTVLAGTQGIHNHQKVDRIFDIAARARLPLVFFTEGGGGRPGDVDNTSVSALDTTSFGAFAALSGLVPLVGVTTGRCFAGNAAFLGCCDVIIATQGSNIGMGGPAMIEGGGLGVYQPEDIGPVSVQSRNGVIDVLVADEAEAVAAAKKYLAYFQGPVKHYDCVDQRLLRHAVPEHRKRAYDARALLQTLADVDSVLELRRGFAPGMITAFARIAGRPIGVLANDPHHLAGAIDSRCADKAARFMQLCDAFDIPLLSLCDCPGFMVGPESEETAAVRHTARMFTVAASLSVPLFCIVTRRAYGLGAMAMMGGSVRSPMFIIGWPSSEFGPMGLEGAVRLGFRRELEAIDDPKQRQAAFDRMVATAYEIGKGLNVASVFEVDDIIDPADSRHWLENAMRAMPPTPSREGKKRPLVDGW